MVAQLQLLSLSAQLLRAAQPQSALESFQIHRPAPSKWKRTQCGHPNGTEGPINLPRQEPTGYSWRETGVSRR